MYLKYSKPDEVRMGDIYRSWDGNHFMIIGFHIFKMEKVVCTKRIDCEIQEQYTTDYILNHCSLASRVKYV